MSLNRRKPWYWLRNKEIWGSPTFSSESVGGLAAVMTAAGVPMTPQQAEQLTQLIADERGPATQERRLPFSEADWSGLWGV